MNRFMLIFVLCSVAVIISVQAEARPKTRYDATTQTCRIFEGQADWDSLAYGAGGKGFREVCKKCHTRNNDKGAPFLHVESKTPRGWNRVFAERYPKCAKDGSWDALTQEQLLKVNDYLYRFGLNSEDLNDSC